VKRGEQKLHVYEPSTDNENKIPRIKSRKRGIDGGVERSGNTKSDELRG